MKALLEKKIADKGRRQVAFELGISQSTLVLYLQGKYPAPEKVEERIKKIYGNGGITCPILHSISPSECAHNYELARKVGRMVSNPEKLKLFKECLRCGIRK
ncbi:MAG: hypothetical protein NZ527_04785 [Hydrogenobacter thermophilus]|nr:hypothetical protein [Hydrogenobacter thermophilus]